MEEWDKVKKELLKNKKVLKEYKKLESKYAVISQIIGARVKKGLTQAQLAKKIGTKQSAIARVESGIVNPTLSFLERISQALDRRLVIELR